MFRFTLGLTALAALGVLAGCVGATPGAGTTGIDKRQSASLPAPQPASGPASQPASGPATQPQPQPAARVKVDADPDRLTGLDADGVTGLLGTPDFRRRDGGTELWRYRHEACALELFLYPPAGTPDGTATVRHFAARGRMDPEPSIRDCFEALLRARLKKKSG